MIPNLLTPVDAQGLLARHFKELRLTAGFKRSTLATRSGVTESSLKRFETSGEVSLKNLLRLAHALGRLQEFEPIFQVDEADSLEELKTSAKKKIPQRGRY